MATQVGLKLIIPKKKKLFFRRRYDREIKRLYKDVGKEVKKDMLKPTTTWSSRPDITIKRKRVLVVEVFTVDKRWIYLNFGTNIRWAVMSDPFTSKTVPNSLNARSGTGGKIGFIEPGTGTPRPGIQARNWLDIVAKNAQQLIEKRHRRILLRTLWT